MHKNLRIYSAGIPALFMIVAMIGFVENYVFFKGHEYKSVELFEEKGRQMHNSGTFNILSEFDNLAGIRDTVYTDLKCWLELRVDKQTLYQHWNDGRVEKYPVSTGNKDGGPTSLESRPGLFAIFMKVEHHKSSQFDGSNMYHFMPFNQGIGFHSIDGTSYYAHLGVRPSSHGCIRMKHEDAKKLFNDCPIGTLVLVSKGKTARVVSFAPNGFANSKSYTKEDHKTMLARNLKNFLTGNFFLEERDRFIVDPKSIPVSGVYNGYNAEIPSKQKMPRSFASFIEVPDEIGGTYVRNASVNTVRHMPEDQDDEGDFMPVTNEVQTYDEELIKNYFHNPIGILPYFGPKR